MKCTYCKREIVGLKPARGINTKLPYCPDKDVVACNRAFGKLAGYLDVQAWKATVVHT